ncbi:hypothetical protein COT97_00170 [Candidatus Falkowbacteria bacterium CG10_big_fil_rev_8_21_14_0_10_39_11]|uniref:Glycosyltransferase 2-like domain-containing protein n=1 Tax=Candidatus Falkowbacteria bacterium CG10_big_fil_rev_8_21_14_0_10_39_11 TaxID=1974565 RepID=A0A2H0V6I2_9BACT|nr:MAG: hypothetical protein COT97_00170 [Candidatus Falkowbacteria bacterium CG10_big_fil_rev_8_21_14_0_10_39_11]
MVCIDMDLSIVILNYKSKRLVRNCIRAIKESNLQVDFEIIVVDNDSRDNIVNDLSQYAPDVKFVSSAKNIGMGGGNNIGIKVASGKYIIVMNPDIFVFKDSLQLLYNFIHQNPDIGLAAPRLLNPDRSLQHTCYEWYGSLTPLYRRTFLGRMKFAQKDLDRFIMKDFDHQSIRDVSWCQGSCFIVSKKVFDQVGLFDDRFFMYFEDTDLCRRMWNNNFRVTYVGTIEVIHMHMKMSRGGLLQLFTNKLTRMHISSWMKYSWKHRKKNTRVAGGEPQTILS